MIQIYNADNTDYTKNGNKVLFPTSCKINAILKSDWTLTLTHPLDDDGRWKYIKEGAVLSVPSFNGTQLFRIIKKKNGRVNITATAYPIFFDSANDCILQDVRVTGKNGQEALDTMTKGTVYSGESDIDMTTTADYYFQNLMEAINGDTDQAFLKRWGGEPIYDNYKVIINEQAGGNYGVEVLYGKNISSIEEEVDYSELVTRLIPKSYNGYRLNGNEPWVDSPYINNYPITYTKEVEFANIKLAEDAQGEDEDAEIYDTLDELRGAMIKKCNAMFDNGIDTPGVTLNIKMLPLSQTQEYKDYEILETVSLGDTVRCRDLRLGIATAAKVIEIEWDCQLESVSELTIGDYKEPAINSIFNTEMKVNGAIRDNGSIVAEQVKGTLNAMNTQLKYQKSVAQNQDVRAILFEDLDPDSEMYGAMCLGTQGFQISNKRTADGRDWDWTTAVTANGAVADVIMTGLLSDKLGKNYWNLDNGEFRLSMDSLFMDNRKFDEYVVDKVGTEVDKSRVINLILSNEFHAVSTDVNGNNGNYTGCDCSAQILWGDTDITTNPNVVCTATASSGIIGLYDAVAKKYVVTNMTTDTGYVDITATYLGLSIMRRFDITKNKQGLAGADGVDGKDGRVYAIEADSITINRGETGVYTPPGVVFTAYYRDGQSALRTAYACRFVIEESEDGSTWTKKYTSSINEAVKSHNPSIDIKLIRCTMYAAGGTTTKLDMQTVTIIDDISSLTQEIVFNKLTDDGRLKGIYMENGELYINFSYAKGGTLKLGGNNGVNGSLEVINADNKIMLAANQNGVGLGRNGEMLTYYEGDDYITVEGELRLLSGKLTGYKGAAKGIEFNQTTLDLYSWNDAGNYVGSVGSVKRSGDGRVGIEMWCDKGDTLSLGYDNGTTGDDHIITVFSFDANKTTETPWIRNTTSGNLFSRNGSGITVENGLIKAWNLNMATGTPSFVSGISWKNGIITQIERTTLDVKDGLITGWSTKSTYY